MYFRLQQLSDFNPLEMVTKGHTYLNKPLAHSCLLSTKRSHLLVAPGTKELNKHAPFKSKTRRIDHLGCISKPLQKVIIRRSHI